MEKSNENKGNLVFSKVLQVVINVLYKAKIYFQIVAVFLFISVIYYIYPVGRITKMLIGDIHLQFDITHLADNMWLICSISSVIFYLFIVGNLLINFLTKKENIFWESLEIVISIFLVYIMCKTLAVVSLDFIILFGASLILLDIINGINKHLNVSSEEIKQFISLLFKKGKQN